MTLFFFNVTIEVFRQVFHSLDLFGYFLEQCEKVTTAESEEKCYYSTANTLYYEDISLKGKFIKKNISTIIWNSVMQCNDIICFNPSCTQILRMIFSIKIVTLYLIKIKT